MAWPKTMTWLTGEDICRRLFDGPDGTHCLNGWDYVDFGLDYSREKLLFREALSRRLSALPGRTRGISYATWITENSLGELAAARNETIEEFGYTEPA